ncbi:MAG: hypothetical protein HY865_22230 [Chloroflexi bacterium]|nr:hypothetical protein [Chloroflexota bacterium]
MPPKAEHRKKKFEAFIARKHNLMREILELQDKVRWARRDAEKHYESIIAAKDAEIARLHAIIRRIEDGRSKLDLYLQQLILERNNPEHPVPETAWVEPLRTFQKHD